MIQHFLINSSNNVYTLNIDKKVIKLKKGDKIKINISQIKEVNNIAKTLKGLIISSQDIKENIKESKEEIKEDIKQTKFKKKSKKA